MEASGTWGCPICRAIITEPGGSIVDAIVSHALNHPGALAMPRDTDQLLAALPLLANEATATADAPNPQGQAVAHRPTIGSPIPRPAAIAITLDWSEQPGQPLHQLTECSRIIWHTLTKEERKTHPLPALDQPTWETETRWLRNTYPLTVDRLTPNDHNQINHTLANIFHTLAALAGVEIINPIACPECLEPLLPVDDRVMACPNGHQTPTPARLATIWRHREPMTAPAICQALNIPEATFRSWRKRRKLTETEYQNGHPVYKPWDAIRLKYPDIARQIETLDNQN